MTRLLLLTLFLAGCSVTKPETPPIVVDQFTVAADLPDGITSTVTLAQGVTYSVVVEGTVSLYRSWQWSSVCAGTPEAKPLFDGGGETGPVGDDPSNEFAVPRGSSVCSRGVPVPRSGWEYRTRPDQAWILSPTGAPLAADHAYNYTVVGEGAPLDVRIREGGEFEDNYGSFRITIYQ